MHIGFLEMFFWFFLILAAGGFVTDVVIPWVKKKRNCK